MSCPEGEVCVVLATRNAHKTEELSALLSKLPVRLLSFRDFPDMPDVVEDGETLEANAVKKALAVAAATGLPSLADDTGLEVEALAGAPGVRSARYAGESTDWEANNRKLLAELVGLPLERRAARFRCVMALATTDGAVTTAEGVTRGVILDEERGDGGFGYDPLFLPDGHARTYAEMTASEKNAVSHRGKAVIKARELILALLSV